MFLYSSEIDTIYRLSSKRVRKYIDGCRIRSFIQGSEIKRDYAKPYDTTLKNFPIKKVSHQVEGKPVITDLVDDGISQVRVTAATKFKNPYLKPSQWLHHEVQKMEEAITQEHSSENEGHTDASDSEMDEKAVNYQQSLVY